jgi:hypothetical protein
MSRHSRTTRDVFYGNYHLPFRMQVSCLATTATGCSPAVRQ